MRVYIPASVDQVSAIASGLWEPPLGYAVTEPLLDLVDSDDDDEVAEVALDIAGWAALEGLGSPRRLVVVAELARAELVPDPDLHPAAVRLSGRVPFSAIACAFVDEPEAAEDGRAAAAGDQAAIERLEERDMLWYDATEIAHLA